jgi:hypothetical protein
VKQSSVAWDKSAVEENKKTRKQEVSKIRYHCRCGVQHSGLPHKESVQEYYIVACCCTYHLVSINVL